jgi:hypothetical protein
VSEHDEKGEERVEDLDVPESESDDVKGGLLGAHKVGFKQDLKFGKHQLGGIKLNPGGTNLGDGSV